MYLNWSVTKSRAVQTDGIQKRKGEAVNGYS